MRKPKIYLETTIFNYYFDKERDANVDTVKLFEEIKANKYEAYTSSYVTDELMQADEPKRSDMLALIKKYDITVLSATDEAEELSDIYIKEGVIPVKYKYDGLHISIATINDLEYIFSLNFKHINKVKTKTMTNLINVRQGYKSILIVTPMEVIEDDEDE